MAKIISIVGQKGGGGKSTLALCLADWLRHGPPAARVVVLDADPQGTASIWFETATEAELFAPPVFGVKGGAVRAAVQHQADQADFLVIDTPPRFGPEAKAALMVADLVLTPVSPGPGDVWALGETATVLREAEALRGDIPAAVLLNRVDSRTAFSESVREGVEASGLGLLEATFGNRVVFPESIAGGQGPWSYAHSSKAGQEVDAVGREVLDLLGVDLA